MIQEGALADLVLVSEDPLADPLILMDRDKRTVIMKDGQLHKSLYAVDTRR